MVTPGGFLEERGSLQEQLRETLEKLQNAEVRTRRTLETPWGDVNVKLSSEQLTLLVACCLYKVWNGGHFDMDDSKPL